MSFPNSCVPFIIPDIRMLSDMEDVIYDQDWLSKAKEVEIYYMYRGIHFSKEDEILMEEYGLRYDVTIIPPKMLGCEFVKTLGHYHDIVPGTNISFPELYEVLTGEVHCLIQKFDDEKDVALIRARQGDKILIPPGYGHITINMSRKKLEIGNWIATDHKSSYSSMKEKKGGAYFFTIDGIVKNPNYEDLPEIRALKPFDYKEIGLQKDESMYDLVTNLDTLEFLINPQKYESLYEKYLYKNLK